MSDPAIDKANHSPAPAEDKNSGSGTPVEPVKFSTTFAHQMFLLVSTSFLLFELTFLWFYSDRSWFGIDIIPWSVPAALVPAALAHALLQWLESPSGCAQTAFFGKGLPLAVYRRWVEVNAEGFQPGLRFGNRLAIWSAIDSAELTFFGNLLLKSRVSSGWAVLKGAKGKEKDLNPPQLIFKIPFGVASRADQMKLISILRQENSTCHLNDRLLKQVEKDEPKGSQLILNIVSVFFILFFVDVAYSTFAYLEMLKEYTLAEESAKDKDSPGADRHFRLAEDLRLHPLPISWVTKKMFQTASTKAGVMQIRADAQWEMNQRQAAIDSMQDALEEHTKNFRAELKLARMLVDCDKLPEAYTVLDKALGKSKKAFVPRMYELALLHSKKVPGKESAGVFYDRSMKDLDEELFKDNNGWPPGVSPYLPDVWHRDDVEFVVRKMLDLKH